MAYNTIPDRTEGVGSIKGAGRRTNTNEVKSSQIDREDQEIHSEQVPLPPALEEEWRNIEKDFTVDTAKLKEIVSRFEEELGEGLQKPRQNIAMHPTWVFGFPTGEERGQFLTVDLGGTNLRVCWITLKGSDHRPEIEQDMFKLPDHIKVGTADELWNLIAECLETFTEKHELKGTEDEPLPLGFTFSYPVEQEAIDRGTLVTWTKGFKISGVEGQDVVLQLGEAIRKRKLPIQIVALVNDTVGALIASAYNDPQTVIGAIFGTGTNAAYMEDVASIPKIAGAGLPPGTPMAINCEWGAFDNAHRVLPRNRHDVAIDAASPKPGEQAFEKMSAGLYLGEILRLVLVDLHARGRIFAGRGGLPPESLLAEPYGLDTEFLSRLENGASGEERAAALAGALGGGGDNIRPAAEEVELARRAAEAIAARGARLCACGVAALCRRKGVRRGHVAADGSVANKHPRFRARWKAALGEILDWERDGGGDGDDDPITLTSAEDGSGIGAAIITSMTMGNIRAGRMMGIREGGPYTRKNKV